MIDTQPIPVSEFQRRVELQIETLRHRYETMFPVQQGHKSMPVYLDGKRYE